MNYSRRHFRRIFTKPFFDPISCGFFVGDQNTRMLAHRNRDLLSFPRNLFLLNMIT